MISVSILGARGADQLDRRRKGRATQTDDTGRGDPRAISAGEGEGIGAAGSLSIQASAPSGLENDRRQRQAGGMRRGDFADGVIVPEVGACIGAEMLPCASAIISPFFTFLADQDHRPRRCRRRAAAASGRAAGGTGMTRTAWSAAGRLWSSGWTPQSSPRSA
jgi:hypothetical protein